MPNGPGRDRFWSMRRGLPVVLAAGLLGCGDAAITPPDGPTVPHSTGWSLVVPQGAAVTETADGFVVRPHGSEMRRSDDAMRIARRAETAPPPGDWTEREVAGVMARFQVETFSGGSGGTEYHVTMRRPFCGDTLRLEQTVQREGGGTPDFAEAWGVLVAARCGEAGADP
ncbi:hypothetical protein F1188_08495 [Roseospira marina]|uniref:Type six secretion immunity 3 domain-containing protein n=1 Tax=Roseospira marina TaxID=140057 RepID=A0A5M6ICQ3_9PROT|nr:Tsi3 family protein [Roseospira marina]KAA5606041.1 hypothetical protein F1188_08495 [Roseospira marina]MBB4313098.1 hypothetical protein [Roseospira marina]MBB5086161.1 hypothetical protein [Roseospira marina]